MSSNFETPKFNKTSTIISEKSANLLPKNLKRKLSLEAGCLTEKLNKEQLTLKILEQQFENEKRIHDKLLAETAYYKEKGEASKAKKAFYEGSLVKIQAELVGNPNVKFGE
uniref:Uncharacterized protein n=1 Tax=Romanomermis culicivorax TaxID=13658 RepID=A0A915IEL7_ROMCU